MKKLKEIKDWKEMVNEVVNADCIEAMKLLPDNSVDCLVTSPPYWALRCYLPDQVCLKKNLSKEDLDYLKKELTTLGLSDTIRI